MFLLHVNTASTIARIHLTAMTVVGQRGWGKRLRQNDSIFESSACLKMNAVLLVKLTHFLTFWVNVTHTSAVNYIYFLLRASEWLKSESILLIIVHSFSDKLKTYLWIPISKGLYVCVIFQQIITRVKLLDRFSYIQNPQTVGDE